MKKILLTGGAGFIGSHLSNALIKKGIEVHCIDNFSPDYDIAEKEANVQQAYLCAQNISERPESGYTINGNTVNECGESGRAINGNTVNECGESRRTANRNILNERDKSGCTINRNTVNKRVESRCTVNGRIANEPAFNFYRGDIRDEALLNQIFSQNKFDGVFHFAARAGVRNSKDQALSYIDANVKGTCVLLEAMRHHGVKNMVFASSSSVYGGRTYGPFRETDTTEIQLSPYAVSKKACELLIECYSRMHGINSAILRLFSAYGPRQRPDLAARKFASAIMRGEHIAIYGDGGSSRDYTYVGDIVDGAISSFEWLCSNQQENVCEIFNLGCGEPATVLELVLLLEKLIGAKAKINWDKPNDLDAPLTCADISKAGKMLGYSPRTSFPNGLSKTVEWMMDNMRLYS